MNTYLFAEKHGNATLIVSSPSEEDAWDYIDGAVKFPTNWRLDDKVEEEEE